MFPQIDGELGSVANHFRFDHLVASSEGAGIESNELKTPLQNTKPFAPDGEQDDEPTISNYLISQTSPFGSEIVSTATKLLEDIINKSVPRQQSEQFDSSKHVFTRSQLIRKQTSLHSSESTPSVSNLRYTSKPDSSHRFPRRNFEYSRFMSVDQRSISDTEDNVESSSMKEKDNSKTQSCANIQLSSVSPRSPGAILVKESYIELPKQKAIPASTESDNNRLTRSGSAKPRFTTTKVDESQLGPSVLKEF